MAWFAIVARSRDQRIGKSKSSLRRIGNAGSAIICAEIDSQRSEVVQVLEAPEPKARMRWGDRSQSNNRQTIGKIREASQARLCIISSKKNSTSMRTTILTVARCIAAAIAARVSAIRPVTL